MYIFVRIYACGKCTCKLYYSIVFKWHTRHIRFDDYASNSISEINIFEQPLTILSISMLHTEAMIAVK